MGKIDDALARTAGQRVYFDTNAFVYFLDRHPEYFGLVAPFIEAAANGSLLGVTGDAAVAETLVKPYQLDNLSMPRISCPSFPTTAKPSTSPPSSGPG